MEKKLDEIILLLKNIDKNLQILIDEKNETKIKSPSNDAILKQFEEADEVCVTVHSQLIPSPQELKNPDLSDDPDYWINVGAAKYFGKETVQIEWVE